MRSTRPRPHDRGHAAAPGARVHGKKRTPSRFHQSRPAPPTPPPRRKRRSGGRTKKLRAPTSARRLERRQPATSSRGRRRVSAPPPKRVRRTPFASPRRRLLLALVAFSLVLVGIVVKVGALQTAEAGDLRSAGASQWSRTYAIDGQRGTIFDRHGTEMAMSVPAATISINPKLLQNGAATIQMLDDVLDLDDETVADLLFEAERKERGFVYVARQVDAGIGDQIASLGLSGVNVDDDTRREMPGGDTGRSVVGSTNIDGAGIAGLELQYEDELSGTDGKMTREIAPGGRTIAGSESIVEAPVAGEDLVLTLDRSVQYSVEQMLLEQVAGLGARGATAIAMNTNTGDIYALASVRADAEEGGYEVTSGNFAAVDSYEPGSVAKVITIAGALDAGVVSPDTSFVVPWRKQYYDDLLTDSHQHPDEWMSVSQILIESSNIGTITVQEQLGGEEHQAYMRAFGLGEKTALDFPGESPGILKDYDEMWGSEHVTVAYGQGVSSTSLQLVSAVNTIANGGVYVAPRLVSATVDPAGEITELPPSETRRVVSEKAASQTTAMMREVVCRGTAKRAQVDGLSIAGKTGTAYKATDNGTYWDDEGNRIYYASFVGFFPAEDPQVTVLISVDEPPAQTNDRFGGTASAPVFAELAPTLISELGIEPPVGSTGCEDD